MGAGVRNEERDHVSSSVILHVRQRGRTRSARVQRGKGTHLFWTYTNVISVIHPRVNPKRADCAQHSLGCRVAIERGTRQVDTEIGVS